MADHVWKESGCWDTYSKGHLRVGKTFQCVRCGCVVQTGPLGDIRSADLEDSEVDSDCNVQMVDGVMRS